MSGYLNLLKGVRVLEIAQIAAGPFAGSLMADLGADVVKVERPDGGDGLRAWPPLTPNADGKRFSETFASVNRNKRSVAADLKSPADLERVRALCAVADVVLENYRPGVLDRLGLGFDAVKAVNPDVIYCSVSGYGHVGPYASKGAFDLTVQAASGVMSATGEEGRPPVKCGVPYGDFCAGLYAGFTIAAALFNRDRTGEGARIDCSMLGSLLGVSALQAAEFFGTGSPPKPLGSKHPRNAPYQAFKAEDRYFVIAAGTDAFWRAVCEVLEVPQLVEDPRFKTLELRARNQGELIPLLEPIFRHKPAAYWLTEMERRGVPCAPINTYEDILLDPHVAEIGLVADLPLPNGVTTKTTAFPVKISGRPFRIYRAPPDVGAHSEEVWSEWVADERKSASGTKRAVVDVKSAR